MKLISFFLRRLCFVSTILVVISGLASGQRVLPFKNGDKVVFMGNSITDGGHYHSYIWLYYMTHFPNMRINIVNAGIGGDVCKQMLERLDDEVFSKKPTVMTFTFGMNDTGYQYYAPAKADSAYNAKVEESLKYFKLVEAELNKYSEVKKIMLASPPYDETSKIKFAPLVKKNAAILRIVAEQQKAAKRNNWGFIDFNTPLLQINRRGQQNDSTFTMESPDRIHPSNDGQMVMAFTFLNAQGLAGRKVADISINAKDKKVGKAENCSLLNLTAGAGHISFDYLANSLPYPLDTIPGGFGKPARSQSDALKLIPFTDEYNQEILVIKQLNSTATYQLKIDNSFIGEWTGAGFDKGINLALITTTPEYQQALAVMHLNEERWSIERRLREYYWIQYSILKPKGLLFNDSESTADSLQKYGKKDFFVAITFPTYQKARFKIVRDAWQKEMVLLTDEIYGVNKPKQHHFEITLSQ
ncbi:SGNH/GDSL hydrolase family protein [Mucilaginibacter sp.]|uniref:SGNH/GDSL hydrolase family protein n=1 Tax=Mucilaginibacter sp. TaxID=1882438 RepID=UPI00284EF8BE|nr:SGNH/GDSL hydrolase family protein [Mucilaginibacter sp.]MDR3693409.1 SGNH/GDSL hydrolase family protein [Mucilaginibacter sp.]